MVSVEPTPNPNAMKFSVGVFVGGPATFVAGKDTEDETAAALLELPGVTSVFMTADFVTLSKGPEGSWDDIVEPATAILSARFD
jgi:hypothetical protein